MRTRTLWLAAVVLLLVGNQAHAQRYGRTANASGDAAHGDRAYNDALRFAQQNNLPHFTTQSRGIRRIVVNVTNDKLPGWCQTFSKGNCYIEPFFNVTPRSTPGWSMLRIGDQSYQQYGRGSTYRTQTYGGRTAFPVSLTQQELQSCEQAILNSPNGPWNYNGGDPERSGRNCTNWVTYKIGRYTGVTTASVKHHMSSLVGGWHSPRMSVVAIMSDRPIQQFGQDQLQMNWH